MTPEGPDQPRREVVPTYLLRPVAGAMSQAMVERITAAMPPPQTEAESRRAQLLTEAVRTAVETFIGSPTPDPSQARKADELFRRIGFREAQSGHPARELHAGLHAATRSAWEHLAEAVTSHDLPGDALRSLTDAWFSYVDHVRDELLVGHTLGARAHQHDRTAARTRLMRLFLRARVGRISPLRPTEVDPVELGQLAAAAEWTVPAEVVALSISFHGETPALPDHDEVLREVRDGRLHVLCPAHDAMTLAELVQRSSPSARVAVSWSVPAGESGTALLWTNRALDLVGLGVIAPSPIVECIEHVTQLWLHAEPSMRQHLCQALLEPLLGETPNSRMILSETLLAWLETRASAPVIADRLGVHPQTVRYRWKRINELFGSQLENPEEVIQMTLVLKASVLMWQAGNQRDFDLFRERIGESA